MTEKNLKEGRCLLKEVTKMNDSGNYEDATGLLGFAFCACINDPCISYTQLGDLILAGTMKFSDCEKILSLLTGHSMKELIAEMNRLKEYYESVGDESGISAETKREFEELIKSVANGDENI